MSCSLLGRRAVTAKIVDLSIEAATSDGCPNADNEGVASITRHTAEREQPVAFSAPADERSADTLAVVSVELPAATSAAVGVNSNADDQAVAPTENQGLSDSGVISRIWDISRYIRIFPLESSRHPM